MIPLSKFQNVSGKKFGKKLWMFTRYVLTILRILRTKFKYTKRNKKDKSNMNSITRRQNVKMILFT
jgi:hypothetical protein